MKINKKLTSCAMDIKKVLQKHDMDVFEIFDLLSMLSIKFFLNNFKNNKELFLECMSEVYDNLEEEANVFGALDD